MRITFLTYGDGDVKYTIARKNLAESATTLGADDVIQCDRSSIDVRFRESHNRILSQVRGDGYWLWKPYIIDRTLSSMRDGNVLLYLDADQVLTDNIRELCVFATSRQKITFRQLPDQYIEQNWTKGDVFYYFGTMDREDIKLSPQYEANRLIITACDETRNFVRDWLSSATVGNLITDEPSMIQNMPGFREHRHDQSMFSMTAKIYGFSVPGWVEQFWRSHVKSNDIHTYCI